MRGQTLDTYLLPTSAIAVSCMGNRISKQDRDPYSALATYSGAVCLTVVAAAFTVAGSAPMTDILATSTASGAIGGISALAALYDVSRNHNLAGYFVLLSVLCSIIGMICVVAAAQTLAATIVTCMCVMGMMVLIVRAKITGS
ncbi:hypothetical protein PENSPDRAFT_657546 [Peniophora sp. CONT]|nr:hypothetical protein PENSPDRAFT_657546 [Peniophora sp. CONT]